MPRSSLTGTRIRERRIALGQRQSVLARAVGISASYLNLIEHNRRRIGGKLLLDIATELQVDAATLSQGAEAVLIENLSDAASSHDSEKSNADLTRAEEFAGRFPGWAEMVIAQKQKIDALERTVETLTDRLTHDPFLSTSLHDVLSAVTAIRSTSSILRDGANVDPEWQKKFHNNIYEDSQRLAATSQELVRYLDDASNVQATQVSVHEELDAFLEASGYHFVTLEQGGDVDAVLNNASNLPTAGAAHLARAYLDRYKEDADKIPMAELMSVGSSVDFDPSPISAHFGCDLPTVFRRLAGLPAGSSAPDFGLAISDASGTLNIRKPLGAFQLPRFGASCALWPLFQAIMAPGVALRSHVELPTNLNNAFVCYTLGQLAPSANFGAARQVEATMLIRETDAQDHDKTDVSRIGVSCRVCPRRNCTARREPSILINSFDS